MSKGAKAPKSKVLRSLERFGVTAVYEDEWVGKAGSADRKRVLTERVRSIFVPLTPEEWFSLCTRDGEHYIGPCCGQTGFTQDILNAVFRDGGHIGAQVAHELVETAGGHDGFELLTERDEAKLVAAVRRWKLLGPLDKLFLVVAAAISKMSNSWLSVPQKTVDPSNPEEVVHVLQNGSRYLDLKDIYSGSNEPDAVSGQRCGSTAIVLARLVPAAKLFLELAGKIGTMPFEGFALVDSKKQVCENGYGFTIYSKRERADEVLALWRKDDRKSPGGPNKVLRMLKVKPVRVTLEKGIEVL